MADQHAKPSSPISQVLQSLGLTREDLLRHSDQMRQFLTAEDANSLRVLTGELIDPGSTSLETTRTRSLSRSNSAVNASTSHETPPPPTPVTPAKAEPMDSTISLRTMDSMEMVIERKSRQSRRDRKERKDREKDRINPLPIAPPSPSPNAAGFSLDSFMHSRGGRRVSTAEIPGIVQNEPQEQQDSLPLPPITPQQHKYYRDHSVNDTSATRYRQPQDIFSPNHPTAPHLASPTPMRFRERGTPHQMTTTFAIPETPKRTNNYYKSPLPASSPPPQSSPFSSPTKRIVNLVSSPGPMGPLPSESDYDELPYTLPPGPYITKKPDVSYAALVGRAILASPKHALTLQEIYDWITIVHPHFKRGETTWMNSIRHVLSTTACFRKHTRERSAGRTLWAIWDCDLECFKNGGFNKQKCKDMMEGKKAIATGSKKRSAEESGERKAKRPRKSAVAAVEKEAVEAAIAAASMQSTLPPLIPPSQLHPIFPVTRPTPHHQPYFDVCVQQQPSVSATAPAPSPSEVICPPLSSSSGFQRMTSGASTSSASTYSHSSIASSDFASEPPSSATTDDSEPPSMSPPPTSSSSASISMPELTPNGSSSSPPLESEDNSMIHDYDGLDLVYPYNDDDQLFSEMLSADALEPGFTLNKYDYYQSLDKGKQRAITPPPRKLSFPAMAASPSLNRKTKPKGTKIMAMTPSKDSRQLLFPPIASPTLRPSTPPRKTPAQHLQLSPVRTPLSHKGLHMSPSASLAHYKSHLDPPPAASSSFNNDASDSENMRTPSRKRASNLSATPISLFPITPKKLVFPAPTSSYSQDSPFRTPGSRPSIFDPHDPGALLDEELSRLGAQMGGQDSPAGLYEGRKGLLYESPSMPSPGKWAKWW